MVAWRDRAIRFGVAAAAAERPPGPDPEVPARRTRRQFARRCRLGIAEETGQSPRIFQHRRGRASRGHAPGWTYDPVAPGAYGPADSCYTPQNGASTPVGTQTNRLHG